MTDKDPDIVAEITLAEPVTHGDETLTVLTLRSPRGREFRQVSADGLAHPFGAMLDLGAAMARVPPSVMDRLGADDVARVCAAVNPFFDRLQRMLAT